MAEHGDGGPAYPQSLAVGPSGDLYNSIQYYQSDGMSLRDFFAAHALVGLLAIPRSGFPPADIPRFAAVNAYEIADAMLSVRFNG